MRLDGDPLATPRLSKSLLFERHWNETFSVRDLSNDGTRILGTDLCIGLSTLAPLRGNR